jgi:hypothetical protein
MMVVNILIPFSKQRKGLPIMDARPVAHGPPTDSHAGLPEPQAPADEDDDEDVIDEQERRAQGRTGGAYHLWQD